jgi:hypothetical protein
VYRDIEAHDGGAWSAMLMSQTWADACAEAMDQLRIELPKALTILDAWTAETRDGVPAGVPDRREIWYGGGPRGRIARAWLRRTIEQLRPVLRVVDPNEAIELERAAIYGESGR